MGRRVAQGCPSYRAAPSPLMPVTRLISAHPDRNHFTACRPSHVFALHQIRVHVPEEPGTPTTASRSVQSYSRNHLQNSQCVPLPLPKCICWSLSQSVQLTSFASLMALRTLVREAVLTPRLNSLPQGVASSPCCKNGLQAPPQSREGFVYPIP